MREKAILLVTIVREWIWPALELLYYFLRLALWQLMFGYSGGIVRWRHCWK
jgi:hypothetical protein